LMPEEGMEADAPRALLALESEIPATTGKTSKTRDAGGGDSNPRHADYDLAGPRWIGSRKGLLEPFTSG
jgi:hypothetical protein